MGDVSAVVANYFSKAGINKAYFDTVKRDDYEGLVKCWSKNRRKGEQRFEEHYNRYLKLALKDPECMKGFIISYPNVEKLKKGDLSFKAYTIEGLRCQPELEGIKISGATAEILYSGESGYVDNGVEVKKRYNCSFIMIYEDGKWVAAGQGQISDLTPFVWMRTVNNANPGESGVINAGDIGAGACLNRDGFLTTSRWYY